MRTNRPGRILLAAGLFLILLGPAQAEDTFDGEVKAACTDFKKNYKKMADEELTAAIDALLAMYKDEKCEEKPKERIVKHIGMIIRHRTDEVAAHALKALAETDEDALKFIDAALKAAIKAKPPKVDRYEAAFDALGKIASPRSVKTLTGYLKYKDYDVIAQTARALQGYKDARGTVRKDIFEEVLKVSEGLYSSAQSNPNSEQARKWRVIGSAMMDAMNEVSRQELSNPTSARRWFNDNKKKNWDKLE